MAKVNRNTAEQVSATIIDRLTPMAYRVMTIIFDNGKEFARYKLIAQSLGSMVYFAEPFACWQRGPNEN